MHRRYFLFIAGVCAYTLFASGVSAHTVSEIIEVSIFDDGFTPASFTIHIGTTLLWRNQGKEPHWPAGDVHPTHSTYPEKTSWDCLGSAFDACRGLEPGETFSFTFNKVGRWGFHDHLHPHLTGIVEVVEDEEGAPSELSGFFARMWDAVLSPFRKFTAFFRERFSNPGEEFGIPEMEKRESIETYVRNQMSQCQDLGGKGRCYEAVGKLIMRRHTLPEAMDALMSAEQYPVVHNRCHELTHFLAREAYKEYGSVAKTYPMCNEACWGGCYHGIMEQHFFEKGFTFGGEDDEKIAREMATICGKEEDYAEPMDFFECLHGLGHAMMFITTTDVPKSLKYCDSLGKKEYAEACYGGVFMENSSSSTNRDHPSEYIKPNEPNYPCTILEERYLPFCYRYQSSYFSILAGYDWKKTADMCMQTPKPYQESCFITFGSNQVGFTQDYALMHANCALVPREYLSTCTNGAAGSIGVRFRSEPGRMLDFCAKAPRAVQKDCYAQAGDTEYSLRKNENSLRTLCGKIAGEEYKNACLQAMKKR